MYENIKLFQHDGECPLGIHFVGETLCDEKYCIERRNSDIASFEYIADGHGTLEINGQILHPKKGDIFMITEGSDHRYYSQRDDGWHKFFIGFYGPVIDELISCYLPQNTFLFEGCFADSIFQHIFDIAFNGDDIQQVRSMLAVEVFRLFNHIRDHQKIESEDLADRIKRNIDNRITQNLSLDGLCADMNYSKKSSDKHLLRKVRNNAVSILHQLPHTDCKRLPCNHEYANKRDCKRTFILRSAIFFIFIQEGDRLLAEEIPRADAL